MSFLVHAQHKSLALAEAHRRQLANRYAAPTAIVARQTAEGKFSNRGTHWTFRVQRTQTEYVVHFDYKSRRGAHAVDVQVHLLGPSNADDDDAIEAAARFMKDQRVPRGWKVKIIGWRGGDQETTPGKMRDAADRLRFAIYGNVDVTRKRRKNVKKR